MYLLLIARQIPFCPRAGVSILFSLSLFTSHFLQMFTNLHFQYVPELLWAIQAALVDPDVTAIMHKDQPLQKHVYFRPPLFAI